MSDEFDKDTLGKTGDEKNVSPVVLEELSDETKGMSLEAIQKLGDVELPVRVVFANRLAGAPVDILVGDRVFAKGEITVVDDCFGVRIVDILPSGERLGPSTLKWKENKKSR